MLSEHRVRMIIREELMQFPIRASLRREWALDGTLPINEEFDLMGLGGDLLWNTLKSIPGALAEYGLVASVGGAPAGPVVETVIDGMIATNDVASGLKVAYDTLGSASEIKSIYESVAGALSGGLNPTNIYDVVKKILGRIYKTGAGKNIIEKIRESLEKMMGRITQGLASAVRFIVPDSITGTAAADAAIIAVKAGASKAYSLLTAAFNAIPKNLSSYVTTPGKMEGFLSKAIPGVIKLFEQAAGIIEGIPNLVAATLGPTGVMIKKLGPMGIRKFNETLKARQPEIVEMAGAVVRTMIPMLFAAAATLQSIHNGDYKDEVSSPEEPKAGAGAETSAKESASLSESRGVNFKKIQIIEREIRLLEARSRTRR
jgi:hypothetical protein